ncbi:riboflavin kinase/FMN adenylyltransferase [Glaciihabitans tibetensis]|uniref:Riboflavin biosynthesis protein n=1 Tax=Glaciihabitans tibetensis TaxID=1266600 RepID=A0A2T0VHG3_9MICO|nr:bifunctional riboflavin kinase/FAD synthetase [Glaciihabitans tibetensis]PRY69652.1 riboflavin kinase/FMN adenylyltransferase [Glaciihabitans tibetensis]
MKVFESLDAVPSDFGPSAVTIGKFDGVHAGHRRVIAELRELAAAASLRSTVVTFDRNPLALLRPDRCPPPLVSNAQKLELLDSLGLDATLVLTFDQALSELDPGQFVRSILVNALHARLVLVGSDFRFGAGGAGDVALLRSLGAQLGFEVRLVEDVRAAEGRRASSTWVRELLAAGRVSEAGELLGYAPCVRSVVVHGEKRGRELGYPTANLAPDLEGLVPADGVYAAWATVGEDRFAAAVSVGNNPTFDGVPEKRVEAHLLDQDLDLYGRTIEVAFVEYVRGMVKYTTVEDLIVQMGKDSDRVRAILGVTRAL